VLKPNIAKIIIKSGCHLGLPVYYIFSHQMYDDLSLSSETFASLFLKMFAWKICWKKY